MTADIRTAAQREAERLEAHWGFLAKTADGVACYKSHQEIFAMGAVWGAARVTPTRQEIELAIMGRTAPAGAKAVMELLVKLAAGQGASVAG